MADTTVPGSLPPSDRPGVQRAEALGRIAEALGRPVESLLHVDPDADGLSGAVDLLRCWFAIGNPQARQRILAAARRAAGAEGS